MALARIGRREVATVEAGATALDVARRMEKEKVGSVVVVRDGTPLGIVTDRDLVVRVLAHGLAPASTPVQAVMSSPVHGIPEHADRHEAATMMRERQVRRLPLLDRGGKVTGIVTLEDLLHDFGRMGSELADAVSAFPVQHFGG
jgi:CBS domain-containing protein